MQSRPGTTTPSLRPPGVQSLENAPKKKDDKKAPAVDMGVIVGLKSDVNLLQAEIDARTGKGGILELQGKLNSLNWSPDPFITLHATVALQSLILDKTNELARLCTDGADKAAEARRAQTAGGDSASGLPPRPHRTPSTLAKASKVADIVTFFHNADRITTVGDAAQLHQQIQQTLQASQELAARSAGLSQGSGSAASLRRVPSQTSTQKGSSGAATVGKKISRSASPIPGTTDPAILAASQNSASDDGISWTAQGNAAAAAAAQRNLSGTGSMVEDASILMPESTSIPASPALGLVAATAESARRHEILNRKLSVLSYLERYIHEVDMADAALKVTLHPMMAALDVDLSQMIAAHDGGPQQGKLARKLSSLQQRSGAASNDTTMQSGATSNSLLPPAPSNTVSLSASPRTPGAARNRLDATTTSSQGLESPETKPEAEIRQLKAIIALQSSLMSVALDAMEDMKNKHYAELISADERVKGVEHGLKIQQESFERERVVHQTRQERAANLLVLERSRANTPFVGSRPLSRVSVKPGTPIPGGAKGGWKYSGNTSILPNPAITAAPTTPVPGGKVLAPLQRSNSTLADSTGNPNRPLVPTQVSDVAMEAEREYLRVIQNQSEIIKDLTQRVSSAGSMGFAADDEGFGSGTPAPEDFSSSSSSD